MDEKINSLLERRARYDRLFARLRLWIIFVSGVAFGFAVAGIIRG